MDKFQKHCMSADKWRSHEHKKTLMKMC